MCFWRVCLRCFIFWYAIITDILNQVRQVAQNTSLYGSWSVLTETGLGELDQDDWFVSTTMKVTVGTRVLPFAMERGDVLDPTADSRLWFGLD